MSRICAICGQGISAGAGVCKNCGMEYQLEDFEDNTIYGAPRWGVINIHLNKLSDVDQGSLREILLNVMKYLEEETSQKLFPSQLGSIRNNVYVECHLYGPYDTYVSFYDAIPTYLNPQELISFTDLPLSEIEAMQAKITKERASGR